jgi:hypothetical protein
VRMVIPGVPASLNKTQRMHWAKRRKMNMAWTMLVRSQMPEFYLEPIVKMRLRVILAHSRAYDPDNAAGACKPLIDALRHWKLIFDDTPEYLDLKVEQVKSSRKEAHTVIELESA